MKIKKLIVLGAAVSMFTASTLGVSATGLKDIFDADYYAEQYPDLKAAFGNDEAALYKHFLTYGIKEGRVMNPVIDIVKYREQYADLQTAFGDDWDSYIKHYFEFGVNENRDNGTDFDILAYIAAYGDVKEAYGNDYVAVAKHYAEFGISEGRNEGSKELIAAREAAEEDDDEERIETTTYKSGLKVEDYYDSDGKLYKTVHYAPNGNVTTFYYGHYYGSWNSVHTTYNGKDFVYMTVVNASGKIVMDGQYVPAIGMVIPQINSSSGYRFDLSVNSDGNYVFNVKGNGGSGNKLAKGIYTYDPNGKCLSEPEE